jgi:hypothetical protein
LIGTDQASGTLRDAGAGSLRENVSVWNLASLKASSILPSENAPGAQADPAADQGRCAADQPPPYLDGSS